MASPSTAKKMPPAAYDRTLLFAVMVLVGIGLVMVYSASSTVAWARSGNDMVYVKRQVFSALVGILALVVATRFPHSYYRRAAYAILAAAFAGLILLHVPGVAIKAGGATRWLRLGPLSFQPSEFARLALIIYLAYSMSKKKDSMGRFSIGVAPHGLITGAMALLILNEPDFGSAVLLVGVAWLMLYVGGAKLAHLVLSWASLLPFVYLSVVQNPYRLERWKSFLDPWGHESDSGYQIVHSLMAFGTGGLFGVGMGKGYQKLFYLPEPHTDFILSVVGEELGLLGVLCVLGLYAVVIWRGISVARKVPDLFSAYLATGLIAAIGLQVSVNMGVTMGLLPTKGLTLPFLSYGGTSLVLNMLGMGILLNIAAGSSVQEQR